MALTDIRGVASATATKIRNSGIESIEELADADPSDLDVLGENKAEKIIRRAGQETINSQTAAELLEDYESQEYVTTGAEGLDSILDGGWEPETIAVVYGQSGTAKTQVTFSSMSRVASEGTVVYLMTEVQSKSIAGRLQSLANAVDDLDNIHIYEAHDVDEQYEAYQKIGEDFDSIDLFVVDSFTAQFRMNPDYDGRDGLGERSAEMGRHLRTLGEMARVFQCPIVMTGQVYASPDQFGRKDEIYGGQKMEHFVSYFLRMEGTTGTRKATVENHAGIGEETVHLSIGDGSIEEVTQ